jgi:hypothetical protein
MIPIPPHQQFINFLAFLGVFQEFKEAMVKCFRIRGRVGPPKH